MPNLTIASWVTQWSQWRTIECNKRDLFNSRMTDNQTYQRGHTHEKHKKHCRMVCLVMISENGINW